MRAVNIVTFLYSVVDQDKNCYSNATSGTTWNSCGAFGANGSLNALRMPR